MMFSPNSQAELSVAVQSRWTSLVCQWIKEEEAIYIFNQLQELYGQEDRHYHNLAHLYDMFALLDQQEVKPNDAKALELAIWFHDAIYQSKRNDNEERSAKLAKQVLSGFLPESSSLMNKVYTLIMSTQKHKPLGDADDCKLMIDLDLAVLGSPSERYQQYAKQIRAEYSQFPAFIYKMGRKQLLHRLLDRTWIYHTPHFRQQYDQKARANLKWELDAL